MLTVWGFGGGYLLWGLVADPYMADHMLTAGLMKEMPDMAHLVLGCLFQAFAFSTIYKCYANGKYGMKSGFSLGVMMTVMVGLGAGLIDFATANMLDLHGTFVNLIVYLVFFGVTGILAGLIYGKMAS